MKLKLSNFTKSIFTCYFLAFLILLPLHVYKDTQLRGFDWKADKIVANYSICLNYDKSTCFSTYQQTTIENNVTLQLVSRNPCIFPFKYNDKEYSSCTRFQNEKDDTRFWCATSVDADLKMETFGYCQNCPLEGSTHMYFYREVFKVSKPSWLSKPCFFFQVMRRTNGQLL